MADAGSIEYSISFHACTTASTLAFGNIFPSTPPLRHRARLDSQFCARLTGRRIPTARFTHVLIVGINIVAATILAFTLLTVTPIREAWGCHDPAFISDVRDYNRGICPKDRDSNANICTDAPTWCARPNSAMTFFTRSCTTLCKRSWWQPSSTS